MTQPYQPPPQPYGQPFPAAPREHPQGTTILVLGILGFFVGVCAPFAWYLGSRALKDIRASGLPYSNEQNIVIGRVLGMIVTILGLVGIVVLIVVGVVVLFFTTSAANS